MATKLEGDQVLRRLVRVYGIGEVEVSLSADSIQFRVPGTRTSVVLPLSRAVASSLTPLNVKSYHEGKPTQLLQWAVQQVEKRKAAKEEASGSDNRL